MSQKPTSQSPTNSHPSPTVKIIDDDGQVVPEPDLAIEQLHTEYQKKLFREKSSGRQIITGFICLCFGTFLFATPFTLFFQILRALSLYGRDFFTSANLFPIIYAGILLCISLILLIISVIKLVHGAKHVKTYLADAPLEIQGILKQRVKLYLICMSIFLAAILYVVLHNIITQTQIDPSQHLLNF